MIGVYQRCSSQHLHRYLSEFDFRYNHRAAIGIDDTQRLDDVLASIGGKRLNTEQLVKRLVPPVRAGRPNRRPFPRKSRPQISQQLVLRFED